MEIPVLQRLTHLELQNPSFLSHKLLFPSSPFTNPYTFFKWAALILLALTASFTTIFKSFLLRFKSHTPQFDTVLCDSDFSDDTSSISSFSDDDLDDTSDIPEDSDDCRVKGSDFYLNDQSQNRSLRRRRNGSIGDLFSLAEFIDGKNVVKLWENSIWDNRVGSRIPGILAEWTPKWGRLVGVGTGGVEKIYVRDDVTGELTVGDIRMPGRPLTEADVDTWWDADAVIIGDGVQRVFDCSDL